MAHYSLEKTSVIIQCSRLTEHRVLLAAIKAETKSAQNIYHSTCSSFHREAWLSIPGDHEEK